MTVLFLSTAEVDTVISSFSADELVHLMAQVFITMSKSSPNTDGSSGSIAMPHRTVVSTPSHSVLFMPSRLSPFGTAIKVVSVPTAQAPLHIRERGLPAATMVIDEDTGEVKAIVNARRLTALRNAAGSLLSSRLLIPDERPPRSMVAIGSGAQISAHVPLFLQHYRTITRCTIFNRTANARLQGLIDTLRGDPRYSHVRFEGHALPQDESETSERRVLREFLRGSQVVITATSSTEPLFPSSYISPGTHLCLIGSYTPKMHEVDTDLIRRARAVVVDSREACKVEAGELISAGLGDDALVEIGGLVTLAEEPRHDGASSWLPVQTDVGAVFSTDVTIFKSVGVGLQDVAIASAVVSKAAELGVGTDLQQ